MASYKGLDGVWFIYDYDVGPYAISVWIDVVPAAREAAQQAYGHVGFWPFGMTLREAVAGWEARDIEELSEENLNCELCGQPLDEEHEAKFGRGRDVNDSTE